MIEVMVLLEIAYWDVAKLAPQTHFCSKFVGKFGLCKALLLGNMSHHFEGYWAPFSCLKYKISKFVQFSGGEEWSRSSPGGAEEGGGQPDLAGGHTQVGF